MRKACFTEHQIIAVIKSVEAGQTVRHVCREAGIPEATYYIYFRGKGKQRLPVRNPSPLATTEELNQSWTVDFMHITLICGRRFRTFNVVDDFNREALSMEKSILNLPA